MELNDLSYKIIGCVFKVHSELGPGLLESTYEVCLEYELLKAGLKAERQKALPVVYSDIKLDAGYRIDLLVNIQIIRSYLVVLLFQKILSKHSCIILVRIKKI